MKTFRSIILFLFVLGTSVVFGAAVYSARVVEDLWSADPAESVVRWTPAMEHAGRNFWSRVTPVVGLLALLNLIVSFRTARPHFYWRIAGSILFLMVVISSVAYFAPTVSVINESATHSDPQHVSKMVHTWVTLDSFRMICVFLAWFCALRAMNTILVSTRG